MAMVSVCLSKTVLCIFMFLYSSNRSILAVSQPEIKSVSLINVTLISNANNEDFRQIFIEIRGTNFYSGMIIKPTSYSTQKSGECLNETDIDFNKYTFSAVFSNSTFAFMTLSIPSDYKLNIIFLCVKTYINREGTVALNSMSTFRGEVIKWIHQGNHVKLQANEDNRFLQKSSAKEKDHLLLSRAGLRSRREDVSRTPSVSAAKRDQMDMSLDLPMEMTGLRVERADREPGLGEDGVVQLLAGSGAALRLFGTGLANTTLVTVTSVKDKRGTCQYPEPTVFTVDADSVTEHSVVIQFHVPSTSPAGTAYYFCLKEQAGNTSITPWLHQGGEPWLAIRTYEKMLPPWLSICIIVTCLTFSALFSGLNLGLMSMDQTDLKIVANTGSEKERGYAKAIMPVRKTGNYLLCSILLGNVLVNSTLTILMDDLTSGLIAVIGSTLAIVIFGEISPQAVCSRHGLAVGAKTIYITKMVMLITFPLSFPISKLLDRLLGVELGNVYNRERLKELVKVTNEYNDLEKEEVNIISGALEFRKKIVSDVMTKLEDVFMLANDAVLDFETVSEIMKQGYSRIPVFEGNRSSIVTVLYIKDLAFVDPDDNTPLKTLCNFYQNPCNFVFEDTTLDVMFKQFKEGIKGHMAIVQRVNSEGEGDPFYETMGIVTLEDVIEELIQSEIVDETDVWTDNRSKRRRNEKTTKQDFTIFAERRENQTIHISPQLTLATFQYLSTTVDAFKPDTISETILRRLLKQDVIYHIKVKNKEKARTDPSAIIYSQGKAVDYFVLILEGRVEVTVGRENMMFESGPFTYFGSQALTQNIGVADSPTTPAPQNMGSLQSVNLDSMLRYTFVPDYTVRAITEVFYIRVKRSLYLAAKRASLMELAKKDTQAEDHFDDEVEKLLHSLDEDDRSQGPMDSPSNHHLSQSDKDALQRCIMAAERGGGLGNDISILQSLSNNKTSSHSSTLPNEQGSMHMLSPTKRMEDGTEPLLDSNSEGKVNDKSSNLYTLEGTSSVQSSDDKEERTVLLPPNKMC